MSSNVVIRKVYTAVYTAIRKLMVLLLSWACFGSAFKTFPAIEAPIVEVVIEDLLFARLSIF